MLLLLQRCYQLLSDKHKYLVGQAVYALQRNLISGIAFHHLLIPDRNAISARQSDYSYVSKCWSLICACSFWATMTIRPGQTPLVSSTNTSTIERSPQFTRKAGMSRTWQSRRQYLWEAGYMNSELTGEKNLSEPKNAKNMARGQFCNYSERWNSWNPVGFSSLKGFWCKAQVLQSNPVGLQGVQSGLHWRLWADCSSTTPGRPGCHHGRKCSGQPDPPQPCLSQTAK